jgi:hypothetical protein
MELLLLLIDVLIVFISLNCFKGKSYNQKLQEKVTFFYLSSLFFILSFLFSFLFFLFCHFSFALLSTHKVSKRTFYVFIWVCCCGLLALAIGFLSFIFRLIFRPISDSNYSLFCNSDTVRFLSPASANKSAQIPRISGVSSRSAPSIQFLHHNLIHFLLPIFSLPT